MASLDTSAPPDFANHLSGMIVSSNYATSRHFFIVRQPAEGRMSGLFMRDLSGELSDEDVEPVSVYEFAIVRPDLVKFLALGPGYGVMTEDAAIYRGIFDDKEIPLIEGSFLSALNAVRRAEQA